MEGPRSLYDQDRKRKGDTIIDPPRYRRGFVWPDSDMTTISPSALYTETAPPFISPPQHLLDDPTIQASLHVLYNFVKVDTPFNINKFENLLFDHPNQPFVRSVMKGLREGFWPFDEGEWNDNLADFSGNYASLDIDLDVIRQFRDKEIIADRWSNPLPFSDLLPGMKVSPMFVIWQNGKPRVVTDHKSSRLNDGIPKVEGHVRYDDMHPFGQSLRHA